MASPEQARAELARRELARRASASSAATEENEWAAYGLGGLPRNAGESDDAYLRRISVEMASRQAKVQRQVAAGATRLVTAPGKLITAGAQKIGIPGADVADYQAGTKQLEEDVAGAHVDPVAADLGALAASFAIPAARAGNAGTLWQAVRQGMGSGALVGGPMTADPAETTPEAVLGGTAKRAGVGAALGGTISSIGGIWPAAKNAVKSLIDLNKPVGKTAENILLKNSTAPFRAIPLTPAEQTGSPALAAYQAKLVGKESLAFQNKQLDQYGKALDEITSTMKGSTDPKGAAIKLSEAVGKTSANLQRAASKEYGDGLRAVEAKAAEAPDQFAIKFDNFRSSLDEAVQTYGGEAGRGSWFKWVSPEAMKADPQLRSAIATLDNARAAGQTGLDVGTVVRIKRAANYLRRGLNMGENMTPGQKEQNRLGKMIADGIDKDVDAFLGSQTQAVAQGQSTATREALKMLDETNARYKVRLAQAADHRAAFASQVFGGQVPADAGEAFNLLMKMPEGEQVRALNTMRNLDPGIIDDIKAWKMSDVSQKIQDQVRAGNMSVIDPKAAVAELTNGSKIIGERFWTPAEITKIKSAVGSARTLLQAMPGGKPLAGAEAIDLGRTAGAAVTMSPPFVLMQVNRLFGRGRVARLFFTEEGQKALNTLSSTYTRPTAETAKALTILTNMAGNEESSGDQ